MTTMPDTAAPVQSSMELNPRVAQRAESRMLVDGALRQSVSGETFDNLSPATAGSSAPPPRLAWRT